MTDWVIYITAALTGLLIGSFLNVVIYRGPVLWKLIDAPSRGNFALPRSYCPHCEKSIRAVHLVPLIGYIMLRGKCTDCHGVIPIRYPLIELFGALAAVGAILLFGLSPAAIMAAIFFWFLIALAAIDLETGYLPDALTLPLIVIGLGANWFDLFVTAKDAAIGTVAGYAIFRLIGIAFIRLRDVEGLGQGDAKLLAVIGAWLGWTALAPVVFLGAVIALIGVAIGAARGTNVAKDTPIPFGPALAVAAMAMMVARGLNLPLLY